VSIHYFICLIEIPMQLFVVGTTWYVLHVGFVVLLAHAMTQACVPPFSS
jgi:phosphopantetheine adenylyltransferase